MRKNKELNINSYKENFTIKLGAINKDKPEVIYVYGSTWVDPKIQKNDYEEMSKELSKKIRKSLYNEFYKTNMFEEKMLTDVDIRISGITFDKKRFVNFEIHLKQKDIKKINDEFLNKTITNTMDNVLKTVIETTNFNFSNKKD